MRRLLTILQIVALMVVTILIVGPPGVTTPEVAHAQTLYMSTPADGSTINFAAGILPATDVQTLQVMDGGAPSNPALIVSNIQLTVNPSTVFSFAPVALPYDVTTSGTLNINITCQSATAGNFVGTLVVTHNSPTATSTATYTLDCTVTAPIYSSTPQANPPGNLAIATTDETSTLGTITISNTSTVQMSISNVELLAGSDPHLTVTSHAPATPFTVASMGNADVNVQCAPADDPFAPPTTNYTGTVRIEHNAPNVPSPRDYPVTCTVTGTPDLTSVPGAGGTFAFGDVQQGDSSTVGTAILMQNNSNLPVSTNGVLVLESATVTPTGGTFNGEFTVNTTLPINVAPNTEQAISITCQPADVGLRTATLEIFHNDPTPGSSRTFNLTCNGTAGFATYASVPAPGSTINFSSGIPGSDSRTITVTNNGSLNLTLFASPQTRLHTFVGGAGAGDWSLTPNFGAGSQFVSNFGGTLDITVTCTPNSPGTRTAILDVGHNGANIGSPVQYNLSCEGITGPAYSSAPAQGTLPALNTTLSVPTSTTIVVNEANQDENLTVTTPVLSNTAQFSITAGGGGLTFVNGAPTNQPITVACNSAVPGNFTTTLSVPHNGNNTSPQVYTINCNVTGGATTNAVYSSNPAPGSIPISTPLSTAGSSSIVIQNPGGTGNLIIGPINQTGDSQITFTPPAALSIPPNGSQTASISCTSTVAGTFTKTVTIPHNATNIGSPATYTITCTVSSATATTVQSATDTAATSTASAAVPATSVTQCPENQVLSTPFPGNAAGEYLLVNCFVVSAQGQVSVTLALVLTNPASFVGAEDLTAIQASPANMLFYRMGSWFLTPSTYNAATQTYNFTSAAGANIYGVFFGTITEAVGTQGTSAFAGTTTGNVEDVVLDDPSGTPYAAIFTSAIVLFIAAIFFGFSRHFNKNNAAQDA